MNYIEKESALLAAMDRDKYESEEDKEESFQFLADQLKKFPDYCNSVIHIQVMMPIWKFRLEGEDYRIAVQEADTSRKHAHDAACASVSYLNRISEKHGLGKFADIDVKDRHQVAAFVGAYVGEIYGIGTNTSFDDVTLGKDRQYETGHISARVRDRIAETEAQWGHLIDNGQETSDAQYH